MQMVSWARIRWTREMQKSCWPNSWMATAHINPVQTKPIAAKCVQLVADRARMRLAKRQMQPEIHWYYESATWSLWHDVHHRRQSTTAKVQRWKVSNALKLIHTPYRRRKSSDASLRPQQSIRRRSHCQKRIRQIIFTAPANATVAVASNRHPFCWHPALITIKTKRNPLAPSGNRTTHSIHG